MGFLIDDTSADRNRIDLILFIGILFLLYRLEISQIDFMPSRLCRVLNTFVESYNKGFQILYYGTLGFDPFVYDGE